MAYQLDGKPIEYIDLMDKIIDAIHNGLEVYYAFHHGFDLYWINYPPGWADLVSLTSKGLEAKGKTIEPFVEFNLFEI